MSDSKKITSPLGDIPGPFSSHEGIFCTMDEAKYALRGVLRAYFGDQGGDEEEDYLFFKSTLVRFEDNPEVDLELDHRRRIVIFIVKAPQGKDAEIQKSQIRNHLVMQFGMLASDARGRTAMSIYRALDLTAQQAIIKSEKLREK
jgi:hypothetical protein